MVVKSGLSSPLQIGEWLRDMGLTPEMKNDPNANWVFEVAYPQNGQYRFAIANPKALPRAVTIAARLAPTAEQVRAFRDLEGDVKQEFWRTLRSILNREFVEFQIEGTPLSDCPIAFQVSAVRYDDGLTLDSLHRTLSSVNKACLDGCAFFEERLGGAGPASGGEFEFKRLGIQ